MHLSSIYEMVAIVYSFEIHDSVSYDKCLCHIKNISNSQKMMNTIYLKIRGLLKVPYLHKLHEWAAYYSQWNWDISIIS